MRKQHKRKSTEKKRFLFNAHAFSSNSFRIEVNKMQFKTHNNKRRKHNSLPHAH